MRITYFSSALLPSRTANSLNIVRGCAALAELGCEVLLLAPDRDSPELVREAGDIHAFYGVAPTFAIRKFPCPDHFGSRNIYRLSALWGSRSFRPDFVFARYLRGAQWAARFGLPTLYEAHLPIKRQGSGDHRALASLARSPNLLGLVAITGVLQQHLAALPGLERVRIEVAHNGRPPLDAEVPLRPRSAGASGRLQLGYAGGLVDFKGLELLAHIAAALPEHDFHLWGGSSEQCAEWSARLRRANLHFHGFVQQQELPARLAAMDACLLPNQRNPENPEEVPYSSPLKLFDYMALGQLILASDFPEIREVVGEESALLLPAEDPQAWIAAIRSITPELARQRGARARAVFEARYTLRQRYRRILDFAEEGLRARGRWPRA